SAANAINFNASGSRHEKNGKPAKSLTSLSKLIQSPTENRARFWRTLKGETVSARVRDQQLSISGIGFNFLPETVNMCFQRVRGDIRIIAPNLAQKLVARNDNSLCPI